MPAQVFVAVTVMANWAPATGGPDGVWFLEKRVNMLFSRDGFRNYCSYIYGRGENQVNNDSEIGGMEGSRSEMAKSSQAQISGVI